MKPTKRETLLEHPDSKQVLKWKKKTKAAFVCTENLKNVWGDVLYFKKLKCYPLQGVLRSVTEDYMYQKVPGNMRGHSILSILRY